MCMSFNVWFLTDCISEQVQRNLNKNRRWSKSETAEHDAICTAGIYSSIFMLQVLLKTFLIYVDILHNPLKLIRLLFLSFLYFVSELSKYLFMCLLIFSEMMSIVTCLQVEISEVCPVPLTLGEQLTHIELERLSMIGPEEFIDDLRKTRKTNVFILLQLLSAFLITDLLITS